MTQGSNLSTKYKINMATDSQTRHTTDSSPPWAWIKCIRDLTDPHVNQRFQSSVSMPVELSSWLLLSDLKSVMSLQTLLELKVTHVLSLHDDFPSAEGYFRDALLGTGIVRKHIDCHDEDGYDMIGNHWKEYLDFLTNVKACNGRVVLHCMAGINRSGLMACAALMVLEQRTVLDVVRHCLERRQTILWNRSFQQQLCELAQQEGLLGPKPDGYDDAPVVYEPPPPGLYALRPLLSE